MRRKPLRFLATVLLATVLLGIHEGRIALWKDDDPEPYKIFSYGIDLLPDAARRALEKGIRVESVEELNRLLEAYLS